MEEGGAGSAWCRPRNCSLTKITIPKLRIAAWSTARSAMHPRPAEHRSNVERLLKCRLFSEGAHYTAEYPFGAPGASLGPRAVGDVAHVLHCRAQEEPHPQGSRACSDLSLTTHLASLDSPLGAQWHPTLRAHLLASPTRSSWRYSSRYTSSSSSLSSQRPAVSSGPRCRSRSSMRFPATRCAMGAPH